ncbi:MAG: glycosyltransferase, partial [Acidobacteria bacterium]|nr:glycosyltransferase [Acidobacteriota bacterium]
DNAARVERLGVARSIPRKKYSAALAEKALTDLTGDPKYLNKAKNAAESLASEDGVKMACDAICDML